MNDGGGEEEADSAPQIELTGIASNGGGGGGVTEAGDLISMESGGEMSNDEGGEEGEEADLDSLGPPADPKNPGCIWSSRLARKALKNKKENPKSYVSDTIKQVWGASLEDYQGKYTRKLSADDKKKREELKRIHDNHRQKVKRAVKCYLWGDYAGEIADRLRVRGGGVGVKYPGRFVFSAFTFLLFFSRVCFLEFSD